jgi:hypothetical protein
MGIRGDMAERDPLHQPASEESRLVLGAKRYEPPLLPFEKQIIEIVGCSEAEYRYLTAEAIRRSGPRPAGYEHIPDVRGDVVTIVVSLAIGLLTSAASYLLTPKPKSRSQDVQQRDLTSITGSTRFASTFGFDSQAELANYGDPIPVIFGRRTDTSGGIVAAPPLVWSRMFSYGNQQGVKMLFVVGEQGVDAGQFQPGIFVPALEGIFVGNGSLSSIYSNLFAFYWKRNTTASGYTRIRSQNLAYGTRGDRQSGDPEANDDIFTCPTRVSDNDYGFSSAHSLSNNAEFGCYAPIPNGTSYRVNWRVITIVVLKDSTDDPGSNLIAERIKIAGDLNGTASNNKSENQGSPLRKLGQSGTGRNYSRRMGVTRLNGVGVPDSEGTAERTVLVGNTIDFTISAAKIPDNIYEFGRVKVDDINSEITEQCIAADEALQVGELFMIGRTVWQVIARKLNIWEEGKEDQVVSLKCIEIPPGEFNKIGLVSRAMLTRNYLSDDDGATNKYHAGVGFYPLMRFATATVRNTRACDVTEIGIRSSVYQRLNGLCNFQSLPSPEELLQAERDRVNLVNGTINAYIRRSSSFTMMYRPAGLDAAGNSYQWTPIGMRFSVVGNQPKDVYNYIRVKHPERRQYEFKLVPKNGADMRLTPDDAEIWVLNASGAQNEQLARTVTTPYGVLEIRTSGYRSTKKGLQFNKEFQTRAAQMAAVTAAGFPSAVGVNIYLPESAPDNSTATSLKYVDSYVSPSGITQGRLHSFAWEAFGAVATHGELVEGSQKNFTIRETDSQGRWMDIRYTVRKAPLPPGHYSGRLYTWAFDDIQIVSTSTGWRVGDQVIFKRTVSGSNPFRSVPNQGTITESGVIHTVGSVAGTDGLRGRAQGWFEELFGRARDRALGTKASRNIDFVSGSKKLRIRLDTFVEYVPNHWSNITSLWAHPTITVVRDTTYTSKNWGKGDRVDSTLLPSSSNTFFNYQLRVGARFEVLDIEVETVTAASNSAARTFEAQSQYADVSFYGNLVDKSNQSQPEHQVVYVNEMVANETPPTYANMTTCGLALKASRNFSNLDQVRLWLSSGIHVKRFHPSEANTFGPSNLFCDLVFYLLTDGVAGAGKVLGMSAANAALINTEDLAATARFLRANKLFFDGAIDSPVNLRQFISETAPYFLCNFVISDGKFSLLPSLPTTAAGEISTAPVEIKMLFTAGNILEDTFEVEYLGAEERKDFMAVMRYREQQYNQLPQERNITARWNDSTEYAPVESFDMTKYCTTRDHAALVAKFFLSIRRRVTHTVRFATTPYGLNLAPGDFIKVVTEASPYSAANNGTVSADGSIISARTLADGQYQILYFAVDANDVRRGTLTVSGGKAAEPALRGIVFSVVEATMSESVYMVEQLTLNEENTVQVTASEFPCDSRLSSLIAQDVLNDTRFVFES